MLCIFSILVPRKKPGHMAGLSRVVLSDIGEKQTCIKKAASVFSTRKEHMKGVTRSTVEECK